MKLPYRTDSALVGLLVRPIGRDEEPAIVFGISRDDPELLWLHWSNAHISQAYTGELETVGRSAKEDA